MEDTYAPYREITQIPDKTFPINVFPVCRPNPIWIPPHWHDHLEWMYIRKGTFRIQIQSLFENLGAGNVVFVNTRQIHAAFPLEEHTELIAVVFNEALLRNSSLDNTERRYVLPILNNEVRIPTLFRAGDAVTRSIIGCINRLQEEYSQKRRGYELFVKSELIGSIAHAFRASEDIGGKRKESDREGAIGPVLRHLSEWFHEPLSVAEAAKLCNLSPNYFCNLFKRTTGKTLTTYVNMLRIHEADRLLRDSRLPIGEVAARVGFSNLTYFGRIFKVIKNVSPNELRKQEHESR